MPKPVQLTVFCGLAAWLTTLSACGSAQGNQANVPRRPYLSAALPESAVPPGSLQFDLVCHFTRQFDLRETKSPYARPYLPPSSRNDVSRSIVDLERMVYCKVGYCGGSKREPIEAVTPEGIIFFNHPQLLQFHHWASGISESRSTWEGRTSIQQGDCRMEPFSGFPVEPPRRIYVRERPGSGPHPHVHEGPHPDDEIVDPRVLNGDVVVAE